LAILYEIQKVDTEIAAVKDAMAELDTGVELESQIAAEDAELASLVERHRGTERESLDRDLELKTLEEKRTKFRTQLYGGTVRNPRQLQDLQEEVGMLDREIGKTEDRMLELMDALESGQRRSVERRTDQPGRTAPPDRPAGAGPRRGGGPGPRAQTSSGGTIA
ncbi:MAG: hypothetical protein ABSE70_11755, partial [Candidatus Limnocylindrales bacterium]